jgi:predicted secreted protein
MQKNHKYIALILSLILSLPVFADPVDNSKNGNGFTDPNKSIVVTKTTPTFTIKMQSNPTAGYSWFLKEIDYQLITPVSRAYHADQTKRIGAGGYEEWVFKATPHAFDVPHLTNITLLYARPWDLQNAQGSNFRVVIQ